MKIIQNNYIIPKSKYPRTINCDFCTSIFEIEEKDVLDNILYLMRGRKYEEIDTKTIFCPCCGKHLEL